MSAIWVFLLAETSQPNKHCLLSISETKPWITGQFTLLIRSSWCPCFSSSGNRHLGIVRRVIRHRWRTRLRLRWRIRLRWRKLSTRNQDTKTLGLAYQGPWMALWTYLRGSGRLMKWEKMCYRRDWNCKSKRKKLEMPFKNKKTYRMNKDLKQKLNQTWNWKMKSYWD